MKKIILLLVSCLSANAIIAQSDSTLAQATQQSEKVASKASDEKIYTFVDDRPYYYTGDKNFVKFVQSKLKYPTSAKENGVQGTVYVQFVVEKDGAISNAKTLKGIGWGCDEEAVRLISSMPKWLPGKQSGQVVRCYFTLPIVFKL